MKKGREEKKGKGRDKREGEGKGKKEMDLTLPLFFSSLPFFPLPLSPFVLSSPLDFLPQQLDRIPPPRDFGFLRPC